MPPTPQVLKLTIRSNYRRHTSSMRGKAALIAKQAAVVALCFALFSAGSSMAA